MIYTYYRNYSIIIIYNIIIQFAMCKNNTTSYVLLFWMTLDAGVAVRKENRRASGVFWI